MSRIINIEKKTEKTEQKRQLHVILSLSYSPKVFLDFTKSIVGVLAVEKYT